MSKKQLPEGWIYALISEISVKGEQRKPTDNEEFTYVDIGSIDRESKKITEPQRLQGVNAPSRARKIINFGDVLVSLTRPNLNAVALVTEQFDNQIASTGFEVIKPITIDSRYIFALTRSKDFIESISDAVQGALYPAAKSSDVQGYQFPLPPLSEQRVIANKIDTLLAQVENIKTRLDHIPNILNSFRQSVLAAAVSGKLTEEWRTITEINYVWLKSNLGDIVKIDRGSSPRPIQQYLTESDDGVNWVKISDAKEGDKYITSTKEKITRKGAEKSRHVVPGDFILSNSMSLGRAYIMKIEGYIHDGWFVLRLPNYLNADFFYYLLSSSQVQNQFTSLAVGGVVKNIRSELVKQTVVKIPSIEEQKEIVRKVEVLFAHADQIEQQVQTALEKVNNQTQSILAKAFRGELTAAWRASHPELISGDNSASALLEKIKTEKENLSQQPKTHKLQTNTTKTMSKQIIKVTDALKSAGKSLSGQELLAAAGYPTDSSTEQLEQFFLDIREALSEKHIVKQNRDSSGQDWFMLAG